MWVEVVQMDMVTVRTIIRDCTDDLMASKHDLEEISVQDILILRVAEVSC